MKIYLASRYSRRLELCGYRDELEALGHDVTSRWLNGSHQVADDGMPIGDDGEALVDGFTDSDRAAELRRHFATEDLADIDACDLLIAFTEPPRSSASRGGRHVELGYALGLMHNATGPLAILIVGHRENLFCWLPTVVFAPDWEAARQLVGTTWDFKVAQARAEGISMP